MYHQYMYGGQFQLKTHHKHIFSEMKATPIMVLATFNAGRLLWEPTVTLFSSGKAVRMVMLYALSRLPLPNNRNKPPKPADVVHLMGYLDSSQITSSQIQVATDQDPQRKAWSFSGWPCELPDTKLYIHRKSELSVEDRCVLWGSRVVVPNKARDIVLSMVHQGILCMNSLARGYVWWPGIDNDVEQCVKSWPAESEKPSSNFLTPLVLAMDSCTHWLCWSLYE